MMKINSRFIVVKHDAKKARLHYDLRFVIPKSKKWISFAVRKGVPTDIGKKVLAVRTHDHNEEEALFLGTLESGYGAGKLEKFDDGKCIIHKYGSSHMIVDFKGKKIKGIYHLINTGVINKKEFKKQNFLLFKGSVVKEGTGMSSRIPSGGLRDEVEEGQDEETGSPLSWSLARPNRDIAKEQIARMLKKKLGR